MDQFAGHGVHKRHHSAGGVLILQDDSVCQHDVSILGVHHQLNFGALTERAWKVLLGHCPSLLPGEHWLGREDDAGPVRAGDRMERTIGVEMDDQLLAKDGDTLVELVEADMDLIQAVPSDAAEPKLCQGISNAPFSAPGCEIRQA
jgi:hypothetical protein